MRRVLSAFPALCALSWLLVSAPPARSQTPTATRATVLSQVGSTARLYDVDLVTSKVTALDRFGGDDDRALALVVDEATGDYFVALARGKSTTRFVRLAYAGTRLQRQHELGSILGICSAMVAADRGKIFASVSGPDGIVRSLRLGTQPTVTGQAQRPVAMFSFGHASPSAWIAEEQSGSTPKGIRLVDLTTGQTQVGPYAWKNFAPTITGIAELVTAVPRHFVIDAQGGFSLSVNFQDPQSVGVTPALPPGGARALRMELGSLTAFVLGGSAHPYLKSVQGYWPPLAWTTHAGPLPGDPVDFDLHPLPGPRLAVYGYGCRQGATSVFEARSQGVPRIGNAQFALQGTQSGVPNAPVLLALGAQELFVPLPGNCPLRVSLDVLVPTMTDATGSAHVPLPIPNDAGLAGIVLPLQWLLPQLSGPFVVDVSSAGVMHVAP